MVIKYHFWTFPLIWFILQIFYFTDYILLFFRSKFRSIVTLFPPGIFPAILLSIPGVKQPASVFREIMFQLMEFICPLSELDSKYRISSYKLFLNFEIQRSHYIRPKVTVNKGSETIQERKLYEEIYGIRYRYKLLATLSTNGQ